MVSVAPGVRWRVRVDAEHALLGGEADAVALGADLNFPHDRCISPFRFLVDPRHRPFGFHGTGLVCGGDGLVRDRAHRRVLRTMTVTGSVAAVTSTASSRARPNSNRSSNVRQLMTTLPLQFDSAPCFAELVASS